MTVDVVDTDRYGPRRWPHLVEPPEHKTGKPRGSCLGLSAVPNRPLAARWPAEVLSCGEILLDVAPDHRPINPTMLVRLLNVISLTTLLPLMGMFGKTTLLLPASRLEEELIYEPEISRGIRREGSGPKQWSRRREKRKQHGGRLSSTTGPGSSR
jgi:hypothetical protein